MRSLAHHIKPSVYIGKSGLTDGPLESIDQSLESHELIKVKFNESKESKKDFATFMKKYTTYSDNPKKGWKNYNASSLTYGIGKRLYKIVDSLLDEINNIVPESVHAFAEFYQRFKR